MSRIQNRQKKIMLPAGILIVTALLLAGCSRGKEQESSMPGTVTAQPQMEQNEDKTSGTAGEDVDIDWTSDII